MLVTVGIPTVTLKIWENYKNNAIIRNIFIHSYVIINGLFLKEVKYGNH